jgi:hypothetical protein
MGGRIDIFGMRRNIRKLGYANGNFGRGELGGRHFTTGNRAGIHSDHPLD